MKAQADNQLDDAPTMNFLFQRIGNIMAGYQYFLFSHKFLEVILVMFIETQVCGTEFRRNNMCFWNTNAPKMAIFLRNVTMIFDLDLGRWP